MLKIIHPIQFHGTTSNGRTKPSRITCETDSGDKVEVVAKFSKGCDRGVLALAMEALCSVLARELGLPTPEAFIVQTSAEWIESIPDVVAAKQVAESDSHAFGSQIAPNGFSVWSAGNSVTEVNKPAATLAFAFDGWIGNPDRRADNPNCLVKGQDFLLIDHELAFADKLLLTTSAKPWNRGGLNPIATPNNHIFFKHLKLLTTDSDVVSEDRKSVV